MFAPLLFGLLIGFHGSSTVSTRSADATTPSLAVAEALAGNEVIRATASLSHLAPLAYLRKDFAATDVHVLSGRTFVLVRLINGTGAVGMCGAQNCGFEVLAKVGSRYKLVLTGVGQGLQIFGDGTLESAAEQSADNENYRTYRWTGKTFAQVGEYDTLGEHTPLASGTPLIFGQGGVGGVDVTGTIEGIGPGAAYDVAGKKGQWLTLEAAGSQHVSHIAVDLGSKTIALCNGTRIALRLPEDGTYRVVLMKDDSNVARYSLHASLG